MSCHKNFMLRRQSNLLTRSALVKHILRSVEITAWRSNEGTIMNTTEVKEMVRNRYGSIAAGSESCCGFLVAPQEVSCGMGYSEAELASLPEGANLGIGCGNPQAIAAMRPGEVIVDL